MILLLCEKPKLFVGETQIVGGSITEEGYCPDSQQAQTWTLLMRLKLDEAKCAELLLVKKL